MGFTDAELWRTVEPGTPAPERRLEVVRTLTVHGIGCGVLMAPVIPFLGDRPEQLRATVRAIAASGATAVTPLVLHLRPGAREWFTSWLGQHHPHLVSRYERLYAAGAYAPKWYQRRVTRQLHDLAREYGIGPARAELPHRVRPTGTAEPPLPGSPGTGPTRLSLLQTRSRASGNPIGSGVGRTRSSGGAFRDDAAWTASPRSTDPPPWEAP